MPRKMSQNPPIQLTKALYKLENKGFLSARAAALFFQVNP